jgi:hypothetical protein
VLTLVINPGGERRVVTIAEAMYHLGVDIYRQGRARERTPNGRQKRPGDGERER